MDDIEQFKDFKVLVVDDNEAARLIMRKILTKMGITHIFESLNGQDAISKLMLGSVDLIISDWRMPGLSGLELYKAAKEDKLLGSAEFLLVSAENEKEKIVEALQEGIRHYIVKPIDLEIFQAKVTELLPLPSQ